MPDDKRESTKRSAVRENICDSPVSKSGGIHMQVFDDLNTGQECVHTGQLVEITRREVER